MNGPSPSVMAMLRDTVNVWIFDLDNTLYPASCNLFAEVSRRIGVYIADHFNIPIDEARSLQRKYYREYGTSLRGLMLEHDLDPEPFLDFVHDVDASPIEPSPALGRALAALPGRRLVYTNGSARHAANVLGRLGVADLFDGIFDVVAASYIPKPDPRPYRMLIDAFGFDPAHAVMVEDIARNLAPAHALGMTTVWLRGGFEGGQPEDAGSGAHIDVAIDDLLGWLQTVVADPSGAS